ncbi:MAG: zinc ribbon domain-containing protein [Desulfofustis sp.]|nr:zinc ribbon domain-containing protein [Desulfofustis sp.]NNF45859.1 zinc ribbon domain-containing protein [Desulfofustis sp.]
MPVYEYECTDCQSVIEIQQKISDPPLACCPECRGPVKKLMSMSSFQLKGGGWYADGYTSAGNGKDNKEKSTPAAPPCQTGQAGAGCEGCPAAATGK